MKKINLDLNKVAELYNSGLSCKEVAKYFNVSYSLIQKHIQNLGISRNNSFYKKNKFNEDFFENIDTEEKAYWLGFLYADGTITHCRSYYTCLKVRDKEVCDKFIKSVNGNFEPKEYFYNDRTKPIYHVQLASTKMANDLFKLGCVQNKSLILTFPYGLIPNELIHHFIRGYFDGDGTVTTSERLCHSYSKTKTPIISMGFNGTKELLESINSFIPEQFKLYKEKRRPNTNTWALWKSGTNKAKIFYDYLYKDATVYLSRKKEKFENYFQLVEDRKKKDVQRA